MNARSMAVEIADNFVATLFQAAQHSIDERRRLACWWHSYYDARLDMCHRIMRPFWKARLKKAAAQCMANRAFEVFDHG